MKTPGAPAEAPRRGKRAHRRGLPDLQSLCRELGDFSGSFPSLLLPSVGLDIYTLPGPRMSPRPSGEAMGRRGDRPEAEESGGRRSPARLPRGLHLQGGDVLVVELVLAVAQHQRRLPHAAFPEQHHLEGVGSARRRPAAGRSHPAAAPPPEPRAAPSPAPPPPRRPLRPGPGSSRARRARCPPRPPRPRPDRPERKSQNEGPRPPRQAPEAKGALPLLPLMASPSSYVTLRVT